jgi:hypothetical protein
MMMTSGGGVHYKSMFDAGSQIIAKEGVKSLFKGAGANILRGVAGAGVLSLYDKLQVILFGKVYSGGTVTCFLFSICIDEPAQDLAKRLLFLTRQCGGHVPLYSQINRRKSMFAVTDNDLIHVAPGYFCIMHRRLLLASIILFVNAFSVFHSFLHNIIFHLSPTQP